MATRQEGNFAVVMEVDSGWWIRNLFCRKGALVLSIRSHSPSWLTIAFSSRDQKSAFMWPGALHPAPAPRSTKVTLGIHVFARTALAFRMGIGAISVPNDFGMIEMGEALWVKGEARP